MGLGYMWELRAVRGMASAGARGAGRMAGGAAKYTGARSATNWAANKTAAGARTAVGYFKGRLTGNKKAA